MGIVGMTLNPFFSVLFAVLGVKIGDLHVSHLGTYQY